MQQQIHIMNDQDSLLCLEILAHLRWEALCLNSRGHQRSLIRYRRELLPNSGGHWARLDI